MPNPKRRHSKERTRTRRAHHHAKTPALALCANCGAPHLYHRVCTQCGTYRGKQVYEVEVNA
jgi:large subunit ribosomal protein L32